MEAISQWRFSLASCIKSTIKISHHNLFILCVCACVIYVCMCTHACLSMEARGNGMCLLLLLSTLLLLLLLFIKNFKQGLSVSLELTKLTRQAGQKAPGNPPVSNSQYCHYRFLPGFSHRFWGSEFKSLCLHSEQFTNWAILLTLSLIS